MKSWHTKLGSYEITAPSSEEYHVLKREIFAQDCYYFEPKTARPRILDIGAHIGLSTLYFKKLAPLAEIRCFEPNPTVLPFLEENISANGFYDVEIVPQAVSAGEAEITLHRDVSADNWWSTASASPGGWTGTQPTKEFTAPAVPFAELLATPLDVVKIDIEGMEQAILLSAKERLSVVNEYFVEFHPVEHQSIEVVQSLFEEQDFTVELMKHGHEVRGKRIGGLMIVHAIKNS